MSNRTVILSSFEDFLASDDYSLEVRAEIEKDRSERLSRFPYAVMLQVSFAELDFANRLCWQQFGPCNGECLDHQSEYRTCHLEEPHPHVGKWTWHWFEKTAYDFGFNEWYFAEQADRDYFLSKLGEIQWGEKYPKKL